MDPNIAELVRRHCQAMAPRPTGIEPRLNRLPGIRAVIFDIYGTLLVSGAGDITLQTGTSSDDAFRAALAHSRLSGEAISGLTANLLQRTIAEHHDRGRECGVEFPEVDIVEIWREVLQKARERTPGSETITAEVDPTLLALEYECRVNPVWPMPGLVECLRELSGRNLLLGIVSNAQAMTPGLFPALLNQTLDELGFASDLQFFSYLYSESKPGLAMFQAAAAVLERGGGTPSEAVYVGNDMLNDVWAASQVGFRTILFAGDERSLRLRADNERVRECVPDAIVTDLASLIDCLDT